MDLSKLVAKLKARGLDVGEDLARYVVEDALDWLAEEVVNTENKIDDVLVPVLIPVLKPLLLDLIDKIDGKSEA